MTLKQLKAKSYGQFVAIKGTVVKVGYWCYFFKNDEDLVRTVSE